MKGYHLKRARIPKPKIEDYVEVPQSAEATDKVPISNILETLVQTPYVENDQNDDNNKIH